ncbi:MAG: diacylglycerol/lipid kinase family protein [Fimbriimonas sp.]
MSRRWLLILNERSGGAKEDVRPEIEGALTSAGDSFEDLTIEDGQSAGECLATTEQAYDRVLIAGGDGTVMEAVNGLMRRGQDVPVAIVPTGTANFVARALEIPTDRAEAIKVALSDSTARLDVGKCGDQYFVLGVGLGLAERFVTTTEDSEKRRLGPLAYLLNLFKELRTPRIRFRFEAEGQAPDDLVGVALVVANSAGFGNGREVSDEVKGDDGQLDLVVLHRIAPLTALRLAFRSVFGEVTHDPVITHRPFKKARVSATPQVPVQIDGDAVEGTTPLEFAVFHRKLTVVREPPPK